MAEYSFGLSDIRREALNDNDDIVAIELETLELMLPTPASLSELLPDQRLEQTLPMLDLDSEDVWQDLRGLIECYVICGDMERITRVLDFLDGVGKIGMLYGQPQLEKQLGISSAAGWLGDYAMHNEDIPMLELLYSRGFIMLDYGQCVSTVAIDLDSGTTTVSAEPYLHMIASAGQATVVAWMLTKPEIDIDALNGENETVGTVCNSAIERLKKKQEQLHELWSELDDYSESRRCGEEIVLIGRRIEGIKESMKLIQASAESSN